MAPPRHIVALSTLFLVTTTLVSAREAAAFEKQPWWSQDWEAKGETNRANGPPIIATEIPEERSTWKPKAAADVPPPATAAPPTDPPRDLPDRIPARSPSPPGSDRAEQAGRTAAVGADLRQGVGHPDPAAEPTLAREKNSPPSPDVGESGYGRPLYRSEGSPATSNRERPAAVPQHGSEGYGRPLHRNEVPPPSTMGRAQRPEGPQGGGEGYGRALHETVEPNPLPGAYGHSRSADRWRPHRLEPVQPGSGSGYPQRRARSPLATDRWCCEELDRGGGITDYRYDGYRHDGYPRDVNRRDRYGDGGYRYGEPRWDDRRMDGYRLDGYRRDRRYRDGYPPPTAGRPGDDRWNGSYGGTSRDRDPGGRYPPASDRYRQEPFDRYGRPSQGMAAEFGDYPTYDDRYREEGPPSRRAPATRRQADLPYDERFDYGSDDPPGASGSYFGRSRTDPAINPGTPANDQGFGPPRRYGEDQPWQYFRSRPWPSGTDADKNNTYTPPVDQRRGVYENSWQ